MQPAGPRCRQTARADEYAMPHAAAAFQHCCRAAGVEEEYANVE